MRATTIRLILVGMLLGACGGDGTTSQDSEPSDTEGGTTGTTASTRSSEDATTTVAEGESPSTSAASSPMSWNVVSGSEVLGGEGDQVMSAMVVGGPGLVAVGWDVSTRSAAVWTSTDGADWSRVPHDEDAFGGRGDQWMFAVGSGGPGLVAVGAEVSGFDRRAAVWTSPDGISWSRVPHDGAVFGDDSWATMNGVVSGGPGLVAVGYWGRPDQDAAVWTSTDGLTWARADGADLGGPGNQEMRSVVAGGSGLVAVGRDISAEDFESDSAVWTSADGVSWQRVVDDGVLGGEDDQEMFDVVVGGPGLVSVGLDWDTDSPPDAAVWTSTDGSVWARVPHDADIFGGPSYQQMLSVTVGGPGLVAVGLGVLEPGEGSEAAVWVSADGISWSPVSYDESVFGGTGDQEMHSVVSFDSTLVAVGSSMATGDLDGAVWTADAGG